MKLVKQDNRIFCTFTSEEDLGFLVETLKQNYDVMCRQIFILDSLDSDEVIVTYNLDIPNLLSFPENTVLVHRHKDTNTLYTINALNVLIKTLNGGILDKGYILDWDNCRNSLLLTRDRILCKINTRLRNIVRF